MTAPIRITLLALAGWALAGPALAQAPAASAPASAAKKELVQKVIQLQQPAVEALARALAERPLVTLTQRVGPALQQRVAADKREAVGKEIQADMRKYVDEAVPIVRERALKLAPGVMAPTLEEKLTEDELRQVLAALEMLQSPAVRKFQQLGGEFERALGEKLVGETRASIEPKLQALEQTVAKRLGVTPAAGGASAPAGGAAKPAPASAPKK
jgi:hypothetical protein